MQLHAKRVAATDSTPVDSSRRASSRAARNAVVVIVCAFVASTLGAIILVPAAHADPVYCGPSAFIQQIQVADWGNGDFQIVVTPNDVAREWAAAGSHVDQRAAVVDEWHAIQACVRGLYGDLADSVWQQLDCHQRLSWAWLPFKGWLTGSTYDLESWRPKLSIANLATELATECLNRLGVDENSQVTSPYRPDEGVTDLQRAYSNFA
jgi:hypothetical protein